MPWINRRVPFVGVVTVGVLAGLVGCAQPDYGGVAPSVEAIQALCSRTGQELVAFVEDGKVRETENRAFHNGWSSGKTVFCKLSAQGEYPASEDYIAVDLVFARFEDGESDETNGHPAGPGCEDDSSELTEMEFGGVVTCGTMAYLEEIPSSYLRFTVDHVDVRLRAQVYGEGDVEEITTTLATFVIDEIRAA